MNGISTTLWIYALTIVFAMGIALLIKGMGVLVKKLKLDRNDAPTDLSMPSANSLKEDELMAVAIAVAHVRRHQKH